MGLLQNETFILYMDTKFFYQHIWYLKFSLQQPLIEKNKSKRIFESVNFSNLIIANYNCFLIRQIGLY